MTADKFTGTGVYALDTNVNSIVDLKVLHRFSQKGMLSLVALIKSVSH